MRGVQDSHRDIGVHLRIAHIFPDLPTQCIDLLLLPAHAVDEDHVQEALEALVDLQEVPRANLFLQAP